MIVLPDIQQQAKRLLFQEKVCFLLPSAMIIMCLIYYSGIQLWTCSFTKHIEIMANASKSNLKKINK